MTAVSSINWHCRALCWVVVSAAKELNPNGFGKDPVLEKWIRESGLDDCNIQRLSGATINTEAVRRSMEQSQPVLLSWPQEFRSLWTFDDLVQELKAQNDGNTLLFMRPVVGRSAVGNIEFNTTFSTYLDLMRGATLQDDITKFGNFGLVFSSTRFPMIVNATLSTCSLVDEVIGRSGCGGYLSLSASRLGLPFHRHSAFSYTVEQGRKLFALMPPGRFEKKEVETRMDLTVLPPAAALHRYSTFFASDEVLRCTLGPGESLIVPAYWNHWTFAIGDSLGISDQFHYVTKEAVPERAFWTNWCDTLVPELVLCGDRVDCIDRHFLALTKQQMTTAALEASMHQCVAPAFALYWHPRDAVQAAKTLLQSANGYVRMVSRGLEVLVAAEVVSTWAEIAERFLKDAKLAFRLARIADSFMHGNKVSGGYWRVARQMGDDIKQRKLYEKLQNQMRFTDAPSCELRMKLMDMGLLPKKIQHSEL